jgi:pyruvate/2-oxoglutarate dehydrogenase complex dihydrolipoamide dehydrogenase (E3) component
MQIKKYDYDLIVIGGGAAGLVAATGAATLGAKVALIEKNKLGGDCTWYGCVPSKALLKSAQAFSSLKDLRELGISVSQNANYDTRGVMSYVTDAIRKISAHHPPELFEKRGIRVLFASPKFINKWTIELNNQYLTSKRFIICTGSHPLVLPIEGLEDIDYLTNENIFDLEQLPRSVAILGGGPIGVEISQALCRLGVEVFIIEMLPRLLFREEEESSRVLSNVLREEGVKIYTDKKAVRFSRQEDAVAITLQGKHKQNQVIKAERVLLAMGRAANVDGLGLENAAVEYNRKGIKVDKTLKTSADNIYACGDVVGPYQFSHMAEYQAIIALGNALFPFKRKVNYDCVPWCTFTDPEIAHLGLTEEEARSRYASSNIKIYRAYYDHNDRAVVDLRQKGFVKVICNKRGFILGAHIVGAAAGELIHEYVLAKSTGLRISRLACAIHIYPTLSQIVKRSGEQYLTEFLQSRWFQIFSRIMLKLMR